MSGIHTRVLEGQLFLYLPDTAGDDGNRGETLFNGVTAAPVTEVSMPHVYGDVLWTFMRNASETDLNSTHGRDRLIGFETKSIPEIQIPDGFDVFSPVHVGNDVSPCRGKVVFIFSFL